MSTLVLGIGNEWASDDGVGPEVVRRLRNRCSQDGQSLNREIEFDILPQPDLALLDRIEGYTDLLIVDAIHSPDPPGTPFRQHWEPGLLATRGAQRASSHGFGVHELLQMAGVMDRCPERVELWGVVITSTAPGRGLSPPVQAAIEGLVTALFDQLQTGRDV